MTKSKKVEAIKLHIKNELDPIFETLGLLYHTSLEDTRDETIYHEVKHIL